MKNLMKFRQCSSQHQAIFLFCNEQFYFHLRLQPITQLLVEVFSFNSLLKEEHLINYSLGHKIGLTMSYLFFFNTKTFCKGTRRYSSGYSFILKTDSPISQHCNLNSCLKVIWEYFDFQALFKAIHFYGEPYWDFSFSKVLFMVWPLVPAKQIQLMFNLDFT